MARGFGYRAAISTSNEAGGDRHSSLSSISVFHLATISAGIRCRTTSAIHIRVIIAVIIRITAAVDAMAEAATPAGGATGVTAVMDATVVTAAMDATAAEVTRVADVTAADVREARVRVTVTSAVTVRRPITSPGAA